MKRTVMKFVRRGLIASGFGPIVLAILYLILQHEMALNTLTVNEVCLGIISLWALAFIAGGMNIIYQIERLPLMLAIFIHGFVLYISYIVTYLINDWLAWGARPVLVFTAIFILGYLAVWAIIYYMNFINAKKLNHILKQKNKPI